MVTLNLPADTERRLRECVARGEFPSIEAAIEAAVQVLLFLPPSNAARLPDNSADLNDALQEGLDDLRLGRSLDGEEVFRDSS